MTTHTSDHDSATRLAAAAPELLEACEAVLDAWSEREQKAARTKCFAAIAKATIPAQKEPML